MKTETIDRLFLELSQVTTAETTTEIKLRSDLEKALHHLRSVYSQIGNHAPAERRHAVTPGVRDAIRDFLIHHGFRPDQKA